MMPLRRIWCDECLSIVADMRGGRKRVVTRGLYEDGGAVAADV